MRKSFLSSLLFALLTSASVAVTAAPMSPATMDTPKMASMQQQMTDKVNINTADAETLQKQLSGIGMGKANAIVAYRETNGAFTSVDELIEVKGIGKAILEKNREKLVVQ
ncbi:helix-hairpin-helix domain-containing protein [Pseudomonas sp. G.S.17]|uniref:ComEA family DNA-binding protein n=1 Tax=Pseudomonas sp. G.S.17 TaxID=3137451 RepID=UPI00311CBFE6